MARILVVDDSASALEIAETILAEAGHQVIGCMDGKHAVQILGAQAIDLMLTDIYMPDEDGMELIRHTRRLHPETPIVAMSGVTGQRDMLPVARRFGARTTLYKPFSKTQLLEAVEQAISR